MKIYGFTKDHESNDYMLVMQYAPGGDLHNFLQKVFTKITWNKEKLSILWQISEGSVYLYYILNIYSLFLSLIYNYQLIIS